MFDPYLKNTRKGFKLNKGSLCIGRSFLEGKLHKGEGHLSFVKKRASFFSFFNKLFIKNPLLCFVLINNMLRFPLGKFNT